MPKAVPKNFAKAKWKGYQKNKQSRHTLFFGIAILLLLVLLVLTGKMVDLIKTSLPNRWNGNSTINVVFQSARISVLSFNPLESSVTVLKVPDDTYIEVPFGFGRWPIRSIFDLGQAEKPPMGAKLLKSAVGNSFGIPVDGYINLGSNLQAEPLEKVIGQIRQNPFSIVGFIRESISDLNLWETAKLWWGVRGVRPDKVKFLDLGQSQITDWVLLPDGSRVLGIDQLKLDQYLQREFKDSRLGEEGLSVGVFNGTDHPQLAEKASRLISNMGGRVIFTANLPRKAEQSLILGKSSYTKTRLGQVFAAGCFQDSDSPSCSGVDPGLNNSRADINLILGEDYYIRYNRR